MTLRILKYVFRDIIRNKLVLGYTFLLAMIGWSVFLMDDNVSKGMLSILNVILLITPLVAIIFTTTYVYNSAEFIYVLISQPIQRKKIWRGIFLGLSFAFILSFLLAFGLPIMVYSPNALGLMMVVVGSLITVVFIAIARLCASWVRDKAKGIGIAIIMWLFFGFVFDGIMLFLVFQFADYPIEKVMVFLSSLNPIGLGRILILLQMEVSALMGYSGAVFRNYLGTTVGIGVSLLLLLVWSFVPYALSLYRFNRKDQ